MAEWAESRGRNVLLAEDDPGLRELLARALRREGHHVVETDTLRTFDEELVVSMLGIGQRPDVIVTDRMMPGGDGLDVVSAARSRGWSIPVVLVTAFADEVVRERASRIGGCAVLSKPVSMEEVCATVERLLQRAAAAKRPRTGALVYLAEDDDDLRGLMADALRRDGHEVVEARDGLELADLLDATTLDEAPLPDLVVTDVSMPGMSGVQVLAAIRRNRWRVPVVIVTGHAEQAAKQVSQALEVARVMHKPVDMDELRTVVSAVLRSRVDQPRGP